MAWDAYVSQNLMMPVDTSGNTLTSAAILGQDGGVWAQSTEFPAITVEEIKALAQAFEDLGVSTLTIGGQKYLRIPGTDNVLRTRKDKTGFIAFKSNQAITIGFYTEPNVTAQTCNRIVEALGEYLNNLGY
ncbi:PRO1 protein [Gonium pectorale]|uniref:Profilin n=1 Tax=Gonium pectorale TaxID=33097 RepID=A0A150H3W4_GONPE|nr:PRO1 protein [Gonium pectorale]|eukprot:KXZ56743.1 PRO1 protein [Gonium pectorale]